MLSNETGIFFAILTAAAVLGLVFVFFMLTIVRQQKQKVAIEKEKLLQEVTLLENERSRIAADLHDELGALISAVKINLECVNGANEGDRELLAKTAGYIDSTMHKVRELSNNLVPQVLQKKGLCSALEELAAMLERSGSLKIKIQYDDQPALPQGKNLHVYRIVQEILNNAVKHSQASVITVVLETKNEKLTVHVTDDGVGFDSGVQGSGQGLGNIMRRVDLLEGKLYLDAAPGKGTQYEIEIPIGI